MSFYHVFALIDEVAVCILTSLEVVPYSTERKYLSGISLDIMGVLSAQRGIFIFNM